MPTRKTDFQICELTMPSWSPLTVMRSFSHFYERIRIGPLPAFLVKLHRLIDDDLSVGRIDENLRALERSRRRSFEVHSRFVIPAAVARTFELVLRRQPVRCAAEMRTDCDQRIHDLFVAHEP